MLGGKLCVNSSCHVKIKIQEHHQPAGAIYEYDLKSSTPNHKKGCYRYVYQRRTNIMRISIQTVDQPIPNPTVTPPKNPGLIVTFRGGYEGFA